MTATKNIPEKAPFKEEVLSTLPDQTTPKATPCLLTHLMSQQHPEGAMNTPVLQVR